MRSMIVAAMLFCLGLFAQSSIASTEPAVYAASDYSALAPPGAIDPLAVQTAIDKNTETQIGIGSNGGGAYCTPASSYGYIAIGPQRQDFL